IDWWQRGRASPEPVGVPAVGPQKYFFWRYSVFQERIGDQSAGGENIVGQGQTLMLFLHPCISDIVTGRHPLALVGVIQNPLGRGRVTVNSFDDQAMAPLLDAPVRVQPDSRPYIGDLP